MLSKQYEYGRTKLTYFLSDTRPEIFIAAGFHGEEIDVVKPLTEAVEKYHKTIPPFLFVPIACPSAAAKKTRWNKNNVDINRTYFLDSKEEEAQALMHLVAPFVFDIAYDFHEDDVRDSFYLYDYGVRTGLESIGRLKKQLGKNGVGLYSGLDDESDEALGLNAVDGYIGVDRRPAVDPIQHGFFTEYMLYTGKAKRYFTFEIPGKAPLSIKKKIVDCIFQTVVFSQNA